MFLEMIIIIISSHRRVIKPITQCTDNIELRFLKIATKLISFALKILF